MTVDEGVVRARRWALLALLAVTVLLAAAPAASAAVSPFGKLSCAPTAESEGVRVCSSTVTPPATDTRIESWDNVPLDVNVFLPPGSQEQNLPLVVMMHGWGGSKVGLSGASRFAKAGYAVLTYSARGFGQSCGRPDSRIPSPTLKEPGACAAKGFIRLMDTRYEVRDTQYLAGLLVDQGIVDPGKIGVTGGSYGGGHSMALAALNDRTMLPDGRLVPWTSPKGTPLSLAAAAPTIPWTDLVYSLMPNGRTLDYAVTGAREDLEPIGVEKASYVAALYGAGQALGYYAPPGTAGADLPAWFARINAGEPYNDDPQARAIAEEIANHHSSYYIDDSRPPAPLLISNGWTDDLFPVDEAIRFYNKTRAKHPGTPISMLHFDYGHARGQGKPADAERLNERILQWFDRYVKGDSGVQVLEGVETMTQTCPKSAPSGGPFTTPDWVSQHPGEVRFASKPAKSFTGEGSDPNVSRTVDPIAGGGACATTSATDLPNTATYRLPAATGAGYTIMGAPTILAKLRVTGLGAANTQVVGRLWDVGPDGQQTLVARGLYRPEGSGQLEVFQLHPNGWKVEAGHVVKLELLGADPPYARKSNGTFQITVEDLELRLPVRERPGTGQVQTPGDVIVPRGQQTAPGVARVKLRFRVSYRKPKSRADRRRCKRRVALVYVTGKQLGEVRSMVLSNQRGSFSADKRPPFRWKVTPRTWSGKRMGIVATLRDGRTVRTKGYISRLC